MTTTSDKRVVIVTGAGSGIGQATAWRLVREGATVVGFDVNEAGLSATSDAAAGPGSFEGQLVDIRFQDACRAAIEGVVAEHGRLDALCNVAAVIKMIAATDVTEADLDFMFKVNVYGTFFCCQAALPHLVESEGAIVNVASNTGVQGAAYVSVYAATKGAVVQITRSLAIEYMKTGVRINAVAPGGTSTPLVEGVAASMHEGMDFKLIMRANGLRGSADPDDVASVICYLAGNDSRVIHGAIIAADQGLTTD